MPTIRSPRPSASSISVDVDLIVTTRSGGCRERDRDAAVLEPDDADRRVGRDGRGRRAARRSSARTRPRAGWREDGGAWRLPGVEGCAASEPRACGTSTREHASRVEPPRWGSAHRVRATRGPRAQSTRPHRENGRVPWTVVIPLKPPGVGKSRLGVDPSLARAIALDTVEAASRAHQVSRLIVVTADERLASEAMELHGRRRGDHRIRARGASPPRSRQVSTTSRATARAPFSSGTCRGSDPEDLDVAAGPRRRCGPRVRRATPRAPARRWSPRAAASRSQSTSGAARRRRIARRDSSSCASPAGSTLRYDVDDAAQLEALALRGLGPRTPCAARRLRNAVARLDHGGQPAPRSTPRRASRAARPARRCPRPQPVDDPGIHVVDEPGVEQPVSDRAP